MPLFPWFLYHLMPYATFPILLSFTMPYATFPISYALYHMLHATFSSMPIYTFMTLYTKTKT
jgi:hypothetical protein